MCNVSSFFFKKSGLVGLIEQQCKLEWPYKHSKIALHVSSSSYHARQSSKYLPNMENKRISNLSCIYYSFFSYTYIRSICVHTFYVLQAITFEEVRIENIHRRVHS